MRRAAYLTALGVGAVVAATANLHPVGVQYLDWVWSAALGFLLTFATSRTTPRTWLVLAFLGAAASRNMGDAALVATIGAVALFADIRWLSTNRQLAGSLVGILTTGFTVRLSDFGLPYLSALLAAATTIALSAVAIRTFDQRGRRIVAGSAAVCLVSVSIVVMLGALSINDARSSLAASEAHARTAAAELKRGDFAAAQVSVEQVGIEVQGVRSVLDRPHFDVLALLPVAGPNVAAVRETAGGIEGVLDASASLLGQSGHVDGLVSSGAVNLDELNSLEGSARELLSAGHAAHGRVSARQSVWLVPPLRDQLDILLAQVQPAVSAASQLEGEDLALASILGENETRRYLVLFGNPAEARELGGFTGATALIEFDAGQIRVLRSDRPRVLNDSPSSVGELTEPVPHRFLEHRPWLFSQNYSAMADLPTLAHALSDIYPSMGGSDIHGVLYLDPSALAALLSITGPVEVNGITQTVSSDTIEKILTIDQYNMFEKGHLREQFLVDLLDASLSAVMASDLALGPEQLKLIGNAVAEDRLMFAPLDADELALFDAIGGSGRIGTINGDYLAVSHINGGPNKLDAFLKRSIDYAVDLDPNTGELSAEVTIVVKNEAPPNLSQYAAANHHDYPFSTNRLTLVVHTPHRAVGWEGGDEPELSRSFREFDRWRHERVVVVPRGESRTVRLSLAGEAYIEQLTEAGMGTYVLDLGHQPLVTTDSVTVAVANGASSSFRLARDTQLQLNYSR